MSNKVLGINGLGRIGKLTLWNQLSENYFDEFVINVGRTVGTDVKDFLHFITTDSTYGNLDRFLYGYSGKSANAEIADYENNILNIDGKTVRVLMENRNPAEVAWTKHNVEVVVDCTGVFLDPNAASESAKGSLRGHLASGAKKVICSAPFKGNGIPEDATMVVYGINHGDYNKDNHDIISSASCTTTGLSHMMKPLLSADDTKELLTVSMSTIHAATNNQKALDALPGANAGDLRRNRSLFNNLIITSTGAAKALKVVMPELKDIPFIADSIRVPTNTVSLISLNLTMKGRVSAEAINEIYRKASENGPQAGLLNFSQYQNVASDLRGTKASVIVEGVETMTETTVVNGEEITHAKIMGWYDNEFGNYVNSLSKLTKHVHETL